MHMYYAYIHSNESMAVARGGECVWVGHSHHYLLSTQSSPTADQTFCLTNIIMFMVPHVTIRTSLSTWSHCKWYWTLWYLILDVVRWGGGRVESGVHVHSHPPCSHSFHAHSLNPPIPPLLTKHFTSFANLCISDTSYYYASLFISL